jgi:2-keto-4-pentenoate hydratase/2-oxohepta-3-ene-1,7-dioic acid hydratase in catechol pathway
MSRCLVRYRHASGAQWGCVEGGMVHALRGDIFEGWDVGERVGSVEELTVLPPAAPSKIVGLGRNHRDLVGDDHATDEPVLFLKPPSSIIGNRESIVIPRSVSRAWAEVELAFVVRRRCKNVAVADARAFILGYTIVNDVTATNVLGRDWHLARSKGLDSFCPIGPFLWLDIDPAGRQMTTRINGKLTQSGNTSNRLLSDEETLSLVSGLMTLEAGDVITTGTSAGALDSLLTPGAQVVVEVEGLGQLINPISASESAR